ILEVADTSLAFDRTVKASLYARAGIADYWVLNVSDETLEIHRTPERSTDAPRGWRYATSSGMAPATALRRWHDQTASSAWPTCCPEASPAQPGPYTRTLFWVSGPISVAGPSRQRIRH